MEKSFAFGLFELDWDVFGVHIEGAVNRIPCLEQTGIKSTVCGPESFTPDHKPLMDEDPRVRGYFHGNGFNSAGNNFPRKIITLGYTRTYIFQQDLVEHIETIMLK